MPILIIKATNRQDIPQKPVSFLNNQLDIEICDLYFVEVGETMNNISEWEKQHGDMWKPVPTEQLYWLKDGCAIPIQSNGKMFVWGDAFFNSRNIQQLKAMGIISVDVPKDEYIAGIVAQCNTLFRNAVIRFYKKADRPIMYTVWENKETGQTNHVPMTFDLMPWENEYEYEVASERI